MERIIEKVLQPDMVWVLIPLAAICVWGLSSVLHALRGTPLHIEDFEHLKGEVQQLRERIAVLEDARKRQ